jgi:mannose-6-phosphate isomerase-like protein (cupin superfamily)
MGESEEKEMIEFCSKPWGYYITLEQGDNHKKKLLCIYPGHRTSLQSHMHRSETMCKVSGDGCIIIINDSVEDRHMDFRKHNIPAKSIHRLDNTSSSNNMYIYEEQYGVCDESDILRYEDDYERQYQ